ncbi:MAG: preprotein translocase subunit SecG [Patescibacteria group bacterium]
MDAMQIIQVIIAVALMVAILLQNRGTGLSAVFGGSNNVYLAKRGFEKKIFVATIIFSIIFFAVSLAAIIL